MYQTVESAAAGVSSDLSPKPECLCKHLLNRPGAPLVPQRREGSIVILRTKRDDISVIYLAFIVFELLTHAFCEAVDAGKETYGRISQATISGESCNACIYI
jgi:hypothetical protein